MNSGTYISGIGHGVFITWVMVGGFFLASPEPLPAQTSQVSLLSAQEFAALSLPDQAPEVPSEAPVALVPQPQDDAPELSATPEVTPDQPAPDEVTPPEAEAVPPEPQIQPEPPADLADEVPVAPTPPVQDTPLAAEVDADQPPKQAPAPRIAPTPQAPAPPDSEIADTTTPEVTPDETAETVAPAAPATAPEQAATEIVTEAEIPSAAPENSPRPMSRPPPRPAPVQQAAETPAPDPVQAAVAEAAASAPAVPTGPPLTGGEKDVLRIAVQNCWNVGSLSSEAISTTVVVGVAMGRDGRPDAGSIRMLSSSGGSDAAARQAYEAARRAIIRCGATGYDLPIDKYSQWQDIEMTFNPERMRIK